MKIEHLTYSGPLTITMPDEITPDEFELFFPFQQDLCHNLVVELPNLEFKTLLNVTPKGGSFTFFRGEVETSTYFPFSECICCFDSIHTEEMVMAMVASITRVNFFNPGKAHQVIHPLNDFWVSTTVFHWATPFEVKRVRELIPYIFHAIAIAKGVMPVSVSFNENNSCQL